MVFDDVPAGTLALAHERVARRHAHDGALLSVREDIGAGADEDLIVLPGLADLEYDVKVLELEQVLEVTLDVGGPGAKILGERAPQQAVGRIAGHDAEQIAAIDRVGPVCDEGVEVLPRRRGPG